MFPRETSVICSVVSLIINTVSNRNCNLRQPWWANLSELQIFSCQPRDLLIQSMLLSLQRVHHLNKFLDCRHLALYRWSRELQPFPIRSKMKDPENTRDCTVSCFNTFFGKYQSVTYFPHRRLTNQPWYDTQTRSLSQNSRSRVVCHCAPQLKLENVESNGHNCGLWKNCQKYGTVHKECWLKQRRNLIMTSPKKWKKTDALTDSLKTTRTYNLKINI